MIAAELVDSLVGDRVLMFGSPPPGGRDLDLLARPAEADAIATGLGEGGFERMGETFARFHDCTVDVVDVVPAAEWALAPAELVALYGEARPIVGYERLVRPAPHHVLLVAARRYAWSSGPLVDKLRRRVEAALEEDSDALRTARSRAGSWRAGRALTLLEEALAPGASPPRLRRRVESRAELLASKAAAWRSIVPRPARRAVVAFSGLDGAGKSSQAKALVDTLDRLGIEAEAVWSPLGGHPLQSLVGLPAKWLLRRVRGLGSEPLADVSVMSAPGAAPTRARAAWAAFGAILNAIQQRLAVLARPGRVVVLDRQALDTIVRMRFLYGADGARRAVQGLAPRPRHAYYLEIRPETSLARKDDIWSADDLRRQHGLYREELDRCSVRRLDGERPKEALCAEIAAEVWRALR